MGNRSLGRRKPRPLLECFSPLIINECRQRGFEWRGLCPPTRHLQIEIRDFDS
jgi:hypothetical protein